MDETLLFLFCSQRARCRAFCLKLLSLFIKQVLMVEPYQSFISLVETIGHIYRKVNKLNVNFSGLNTVRRNKEPI